MDFQEIYNRLTGIDNYNDFVKKDGLRLYKTMFSYFIPDNDIQFKQITKISEELEKILIDSRKFSLALDLYNFEIDFFHHNYTSEKLTAAYKKSIMLYTVLESISTRESYEITENFDNLIQHFEQSNLHLQKRFKSLYFEIIYFLEKEDSGLPEKLQILLEENLNNLIIESEFHTNHYVHYLKDAYRKLEKLYEKYHYQALEDNLTKLNNRRHLYANYPSLIYLAQRQKIAISILLFDIDNFKLINNKYGHKKGDEILIFIADIFKTYIRKSDFIIRFGGDEFLIFLYDSEIRTAVMIAESIREEIVNHKFVVDNGEEFYISISVGITSRKPSEEIQDETNISDYFEDIIKEADISMYHAKYDPKNKINTYHEGLSSLIN